MSSAHPKRALTATTSTADSAVDSASRAAGGSFRPALRSISFGSCYIYSPRGDGYASAASRLLCERLKAADAGWLPHCAGSVRQQTMQHEALASLFAEDTILVPVPGSRPTSVGIWAAERLAVALHGVGLGQSVWPVIQRRFPVRKSATAVNTERPTVRQHHESFAIVPLPRAALFAPPRRMILVDDVITKGRTIFAAALRLHEAFPRADIRGFALVRTLGFLSNVSRCIEPCQGVIRWAGGDTRREP